MFCRLSYKPTRGLSSVGVRSRWDTLHAGRPFAAKYPARPESAEAIAADVAEYLAARYQV